MYDLPSELLEDSRRDITRCPVAPDDPSEARRLSRWRAFFIKATVALVLLLLCLLTALMHLTLSGVVLSREVSRQLSQALGLEVHVRSVRLTIAEGALDLEDIRIGLPGPMNYSFHLGSIEFRFDPHRMVFQGLQAVQYIRLRSGETLTMLDGPEGLRPHPRLKLLLDTLGRRRPADPPAPAAAAQAPAAEALPRADALRRLLAALPDARLDVEQLAIRVVLPSRYPNRPPNIDHFRLDRLRTLPRTAQLRAHGTLDAPSGGSSPFTLMAGLRGQQGRWRLTTGTHKNQTMLQNLSWHSAAMEGRLDLSRSRAADIPMSVSLLVRDLTLDEPHLPGVLNFGPVELHLSGAIEPGQALPPHLQIRVASPTGVFGGDAIRRPRPGGGHVLHITLALDWLASSVIHYLWEPPRVPISHLEIAEGPAVMRLEVHEIDGRIPRDLVAWRLDLENALLRVNHDGLRHVELRARGAAHGNLEQIRTDGPVAITLPSGAVVEATYDSWGQRWFYRSMEVRVSARARLTQRDVLPLFSPRWAAAVAPWNLRFDADVEVGAYMPPTRPARILHTLSVHPRQARLRLPAWFIEPELELTGGTLRMQRDRFEAIGLEGNLGGLPVVADALAAQSAFEATITARGDAARAARAFHPIMQPFHVAGQLDATTRIRIGRPDNTPSLAVTSLERIIAAAEAGMTTIDVEGTLAQGEFAHLTMPTIFRDVEAQLSYAKDVLTLRQMTARVDEGETRLEGTLRFPPGDLPKLRLSGDITHLNINTWASQWYSLDDMLAQRGEAEILHPTPATPRLPERAFELDLALYADHFLWNNLRGTRLGGTLNFRAPVARHLPTVMSIPRLRVNAYGGMADVRVICEFPHDGQGTYRVWLDGRDLALTPLLTDLYGTNSRLYGTVRQIRAQEAGPITTDETLRQGRVRLDVVQSNVLQIPLFDPVIRALGLNVGRLAEGSSARGVVFIHEGKYFMEDFRVDHPLLALMFRGSVNLDGQQLDMQALANFNEAWTSSMPIINIIGTAMDDVSNRLLALGLQGSFDQVRVRTTHVRNLREAFRGLFSGEAGAFPVWNQPIHSRMMTEVFEEMATLDVPGPPPTLDAPPAPAR